MLRTCCDPNPLFRLPVCPFLWPALGVPRIVPLPSHPLCREGNLSPCLPCPFKGLKLHTLRRWGGCTGSTSLGVGHRAAPSFSIPSGRACVLLRSQAAPRVPGVLGTCAGGTGSQRGRQPGSPARSLQSGGPCRRRLPPSVTASCAPSQDAQGSSSFPSGPMGPAELSLLLGPGGLPPETHSLSSSLGSSPLPGRASSCSVCPCGLACGRAHTSVLCEPSPKPHAAPSFLHTALRAQDPPVHPIRGSSVRRTPWAQLPPLPCLSRSLPSLHLSLCPPHSAERPVGITWPFCKGEAAQSAP